MAHVDCARWELQEKARSSKVKAEQGASSMNFRKSCSGHARMGSQRVDEVAVLCPHLRDSHHQEQQNPDTLNHSGLIELTFQTTWKEHFRHSSPMINPLLIETKGLACT